MTTSIVDVIQHYQRSIDSSQDNEARLLHCIQKLYNLPIKVEHLQETGVGKTVNSLRKFNGEIGVAAKSLVTKWKAMVAAEEEPMDTTPQSNDNEPQNNNNNDDDHDPSPHNGMDDEGDENQNHHNTPTQQTTHSGHSGKEKHKERHKERSHSSSSSVNHKESSSKHTASSSSSSSSKHSNDKHNKTSSSKDKESHHKSNSSKEREKEKTEHKSRDKHKDKDHEKDRERSEKRRDEKHKSEKEINTDSSNHKNNGSSSSSSKSKSEDKHNHQSSSKDKTDKGKERSDKHKSSSKDKERTKEEKSSPSSGKDKNERKSSSSSSHKSSSSAKDLSDTSERKRRHNSDTESSDFKSPQPKAAKVKNSSNSVKTVESTSPPQEDDPDDCFDSSMGANFGDILGMLNVPTKKGKKSGKSSVGSGSSSSKDSPPKPSTSNSNTPSKFNGVNSSPSIYTPLPAIKRPTARPDLLAPTAKLAPLDPSIALELPTISTNYKPMPLNQTVMDCVFNTASSSSSKPVRSLTDAEALQHGISSKTMRTKIYSGTRTGQIFQVSSLFDMCIRILQKNIDALEYTGGVPFEVLRPVLERATPQQLFVFEDYNPYLMEDSDILWQFHVSRNYRTQKRLENESWREMFMRCQEEEERRLSILKDSIKASQKIAAAPVRKTQMAFVDSMVKPPRNVMRKQEQYGTKSKLVATPAARVASLQSVTPNAGKTGDNRLKVASAVRDHAQVSNSAIRPKKAPLMQKTLAFIRGRHKR